jgi:hypothetical protein
MSTIAAPNSSTLFTRQVTAGHRSFFFDVKKAPRGELFFTISELSSRGGVWTRSRVLVPANEAKEFYYGLCETIKAMREADPSIGTKPKAENGSLANSNQTEQILASPNKSGKSHRATGRASQGANRQALLA